MSTFTGTLLEYPYISIDRFDRENLHSAVYFLSHCHKDHIVGLMDNDFIEVLKAGFGKKKLYTSETSYNLMCCDQQMLPLLDYVVGLPINQPKTLPIPMMEKTETTIKNITVTLIPAGHCVGSVMFLIEGDKGKVLYTGDFRLGSNDTKKLNLFKTERYFNFSDYIQLESVYIDTTFCCPQFPDFPSRERTKDCLIEIIGEWIKHGSNHIVHLKCKGKYGYEYIMKEVAKHFRMKIHVREWRLKMSSYLPKMLKHFTTNANETQIHSCYFGKETNHHQIPCGLKSVNGKPVKIITIIPSSLYFLTIGQGIPQSGKLWIEGQKLWRVFHSMHASYNEIIDFLGHLRTENVYPCVPPVDCQDILTAYNRLQHLCVKVDENQSQSTDLNQPKKESRDFSKGQSNWCNDIIKKASVGYGTCRISPSPKLHSPPPMTKRRKRNIHNVSHSINKLKESENLTNIKTKYEKDISSKMLPIGNSESNSDVFDVLDGIGNSILSNVECGTETEAQSFKIESKIEVQNNCVGKNEMRDQDRNKSTTKFHDKSERISSPELHHDTTEIEAKSNIQNDQLENKLKLFTSSESSNPLISSSPQFSFDGFHSEDTLDKWIVDPKKPPLEIVDDCSDTSTTSKTKNCQSTTREIEKKKEVNTSIFTIIPVSDDSDQGSRDSDRTLSFSEVSDQSQEY